MEGAKNSNLFLKVEIDEETADQNEAEEEEEETTDEEDNEDEDDATYMPQPVPFRQLFRYSGKLEWILTTVGLLAACISGTAPVITIVFLGRLSQALVEYGTLETINKCTNSTRKWTAEDIADLSQYDIKIKIISDDELFLEIKSYVTNTITVALLQMAFNYIMVASFNATAEHQAFRIRNRFLRAILRQDIAWYDTHQTGEFASRTADDLCKLQDGIGEKLGMFSYFLVNFLTCVINAFMEGWRLTMVMLCIMPITFFTVILLNVVQTSIANKELNAYAKAGSVAEEAFTAIRTVVAYGGEAKEADRYRKNLKAANTSGIQKGFMIALNGGVCWFLIYAGYALSFWYGINIVIDERELPNPTYTVSSFIVIFFSVVTGSMQLGKCLSYMDTLAQARAAAGMIFSIIERIPYIDSLSGRGLTPANVDGCIQLENVNFDYPSRQQVRVLDGLDLEVKSGETLALIGESGCGKSTVVQLIQRFYDPGSGIIKLDNCDIKLLNVGWLRENIGVVSQEPVLFGTTIAENIRYGQEGATQEDIEKAAKMANAHDFIIKLPMKYKTQVGDRGTKLSGGQKQRVAIARALIKNPRILLLDEATSALDSESEGIIQEALDKARQGRTTIIIAHRLSTIRNANKIAVLSKGRVCELGTHDQLMALEKIYYQMVKTQDRKDIEEQLEPETEIVSLQDNKSPKNPDASSLPPVEFTSWNGSVLPKYKARHPSIIQLVEDIEDQPTSSLLKIFKYNEPEWVYNLLGCLGSLIMACNTPAFALIFGEVMGVLSDCDPDHTRKQTLVYSYLFLTAGAVIAIATFFQLFMFAIAGQYLTQRLRRMLFTAMLKQDMNWFDDQQNSIGALCTRLSGDTASVHGAAGPRIGIIVQSFGSIAASIIVSLVLCWQLSLASVTFVPIILFTAYINNKIIQGQSILEIISLNRANTIAIEAISNIRTVASLHRERTIHALYKESLQKPHRSALRLSHFRGLIFGVGQCAPYFAYVICLYYGGYMVVHNSLPYATVFKVAELLILGTLIVGDSFAFAPNYSRGLVAAKRIFDIIERVPSIDSSSTDGRKLPEDKSASIQFQNVKFTYASRPETQILRGLDLTIPAGKLVALVGSSGCGKSTCVQLLERFYDPTSGSVTIDGKDLTKLNIAWLRSQIGIVSQEPILFDRTIAENIAYGDNGRNPSMQEIVQAAMTANAHNFVSALPQGYHTRVGEKGTQLSGGQKQRIAIARALVRNPKILLLDEATSSLDSESEKLVQEAMEEAQKGRTCITVAHRLSTIQNADLIAVIHKGSVMEIGTHDQLIELNGHYKKYYQMQTIGHT